jgi:hypothetical protein
VCPYSGGDPPAPVPVECGIELDCKTDETENLAFEEIQDGVETLIASRLVKGKRVSQSGRIEFVQLRLTAKGEAEAIAAARAKISKATKERWAKFRAGKAKGKQ